MQEKIKKLKKIKILFVENEHELVDIFCDTFTKIQANYLTALNGKEALELIKQNDDIDLVVTDINMPIMNGIELIEKAKKIRKNLHFVIISAHTELQYREDANRLGVKSYLLKPFDFIKFINLIVDLDLK